MTLHHPSPTNLEELYHEHGTALRSYLRARTGSAVVAEDLLQDVFVAVLDRGMPPGPAGPWLFGIARNLMRQHCRSYRSSESLEDTLPSSAPEVSTRLAHQDRVGAMRAALGALHPDLSEVLLLHYEAGCTYPQIAAALSLPQSTVQSRLRRGREALRLAVVSEGSR